MSTRTRTSTRTFVSAGTLAFLLCAGLAAAEETSFDLSLAGSGSGDPDGAGQGTITIDSDTNQISWELSYSNIDEPTAMHIHLGAAGESGGVAVPLTVEKDTDGNLVGLTNAPAEVVQALLASPSGYYVNIHNAEHRGGAIRGQLGNGRGDLSARGSGASSRACADRRSARCLAAARRESLFLSRRVVDQRLHHGGLEVVA